MKRRSLLVPRGAWLAAILVWASALTFVTYRGIEKAANGLSVEDCRLPGSTLAPRSCLIEKHSEWFWSLATTNLPWLIIFGLVLPFLAQAGVRLIARKLSPAD